MNRPECERLILEKLREIVDIYHEYNPDGNYLNLMYMNEEGDQFMKVNNENWPAMDGEPAGLDYDHPIEFVYMKEGAQG